MSLLARLIRRLLYRRYSSRNGDITIEAPRLRAPWRW